jgi:coenzyme F420 hydrogenase subunit beta
MYYCSTAAGREKIGPVLGLFCFWGLDYSFYRFLRAAKGVNRIYRADIPKDEGLTLETDRGTVRFSLDETRSHVRRGCHSCIDPTAELADLSIGSTESDPAWCTLIVRTAAGEALLQKALERELLEARPCPAGAAGLLREAALAKKRRVLAAAPAAAGDSPPVNNAYIRLADDTRRRITGEGT